MTRRLGVTTTHPIGSVGLVLMVLVARLAEPGFTPDHEPRRGVRAFLARRAIDGIAAIGWTVDRLCGVSRGGRPRAHRRMARPA